MAQTCAISIVNVNPDERFFKKICSEGSTFRGRGVEQLLVHRNYDDASKFGAQVQTQATGSCYKTVVMLIRTIFSVILPEIVLRLLSNVMS